MAFVWTDESRFVREGETTRTVITVWGKLLTAVLGLVIAAVTVLIVGVMGR